MTYFAIFSLLFFTAFLILAVMWCARSILPRKPRITAKAHQPPSPGTGTGDETLLYCSFCGKDQHAVRKLITGPEANICNECAEGFGESNRSTDWAEWRVAAKNQPKPADIEAVLDP